MSADAKTRALSTEHREDLRRLLLFRTVAATALLLPTLYYQLLLGPEGSLGPVYGVIGASYLVGIVYVLLQAVLPAWRGLITVQLTVDAILITALIHVMGGVRSPLALLYLLLAFGAGVMIPRQTALAVACLSGVLYGLGAHLALAGWIPPVENPFSGPIQSVSPAELYLRIFLVLLSAAAVAVVTGGFVERLRAARRELARERDAFEALQRLNQQLLAGMSSGLIAAGSDGRIVATNRAAERITELDENSLTGADVREVLGFDADDFAELDERLRERQIYRTERQVPLPGGGLRSVGISVTRVDEIASDRDDDEAPPGGYSPGGPWRVHGGGPMAGGYIFMFQDLTDIKRLERVFWMRERMALLGEMAGSLAHEIRNPLASISGSLQMLQRKGGQDDPARSQRLMGIVTKESERLSRIIEDFLDYARPEKLDAVDTDLVALVRETTELLENSPELNAGHRIEIVAEEDEVRALVDGSRIKQVFWNLARNSVTAMADGGTLSFRIRRTPTGACVVVEDEGVGMSAAEVDRIFRPFVSETATGLGLAIVYRIMEMHGARIEVESEPGKGTAFELNFQDAAVPHDGAAVVTVEAGTERASREFDEIRRQVRSD
jgi:two-component system sensor histidine kinase PilS (NtrC family)